MYLTKTEGVVIRSYDFGEGHRIVVIFTEVAGKVRAVARGSRKTKSKFGASLEPLSQNHFLLYRKPGQALFTITGCMVLDSHSKLRENINLFGYSSIALEGIDLFLAEEDHDIALYNLFNSAIKDIENNNPASIVWLFMFRLLKYSGYRLDFFQCAGCGSKDLIRVSFSLKNGGVLCEQCCWKDKTSWPLSRKTITSIKKLAAPCKLDDDVEMEIRNVIKKFIEYQFNKNLKSLDFINLFKKKEEQCISRS